MSRSCDRRTGRCWPDHPTVPRGRGDMEKTGMRGPETGPTQSRRWGRPGSRVGTPTRRFRMQEEGTAG